MRVLNVTSFSFCRWHFSDNYDLVINVLTKKTLSRKEECYCVFCEKKIFMHFTIYKDTRGN